MFLLAMLTMQIFELNICITQGLLYLNNHMTEQANFYHFKGPFIYLLAAGLVNQRGHSNFTVDLGVIEILQSSGFIHKGACIGISRECFSDFRHAENLAPPINPIGKRSTTLKPNQKEHPNLKQIGKKIIHPERK